MEPISDCIEDGKNVRNDPQNWKIVAKIHTVFVAIAWFEITSLQKNKKFLPSAVWYLIDRLDNRVLNGYVQQWSVLFDKN